MSQADTLSGQSTQQVVQVHCIEIDSDKSPRPYGGAYLGIVDLNDYWYL
jgi:hypothetical protein